MDNSQLLLDVALGGAGIYLINKIITSRKRNGLPYPPGPPGLPLIGNIMMRNYAMDIYHWAELGKTYGDIVHLDLAGTHILGLNSSAAALAMLDHKGIKYSGRQNSFFINKLVGWQDMIQFTEPGPRFKEMRGMTARTIGTRSALERFQPMQLRENIQFLRRLLDTPEEYQLHTHKLATAVILEISHGHHMQDGIDEMDEKAKKVMGDFDIAASPGRFAVDAIPSLSKLPSFFPGQGYRKIAKEMRTVLYKFIDEPYETVKQELAMGTASPSMAATLIETSDSLTPEREHIIKWVSGSLYAAGSDTTAATLETFILCMLLNPDALAKAQAEIDAIIGPDRLPGVQDRQSLPYVNALIKEVLRFEPVTPMGLLHSTTDDDVFEGCFIPKGTQIIPNIWAMSRDPRVYTNPLEFRPERHMGDKPEQDPLLYVFGFGRRICPGMELAQTSLFLAIAGAVATMRIEKAIGEDGKPIVPSREMEGILLRHPKRMQYSLTPRSTQAESLIRTTWEELVQA